MVYTFSYNNPFTSESGFVSVFAVSEDMAREESANILEESSTRLYLELVECC